MNARSVRAIPAGYPPYEDHVCPENDVVVGDGQTPLDLLNLFMGGFTAYALQLFDHRL